MANSFKGIEPELQAWIARQHLFFVATAPLSGDGLVNCSPKGMDSLRVLEPRRVAYLDLTGSGAETIAHVRENGRIVFMFCAFEGPPRIVRLHGRAEIVLPDSAAWDALAPQFAMHQGARAIVSAELSRISDSCGYAVPLYEFKAERDVLTRWTEKKGDEGLKAYRAANNAKSLDGLPGLG